MPDTSRDLCDFAPFDAYTKHNVSGFVLSNIETWTRLHAEIVEKCSKFKCHVVFYEDLQKNMIDEMTIILNYIGFDMNAAIEKCLTSCGTGKFKRKTKPKKLLDKIYSLFTKQQLEYFDTLYTNYRNKLIEIN